ncbi:MAG: insulinase family protein [Chthoniobacterales bacterium]|nr:insulinase family protein [Chthoniobacterales bacterium]
MCNRFARLLLFLAISAAPAFANTAPPALQALPFPQDTSDLKPDPAAHFGKLKNGLRYVILPNHEPKGRASLRLLVLAGSLQESEEQRGLAHFLEHMAFNGSRHYPPGTLVEFFQRMGMSFGGDTNANTGFERTVYLLELPRADDATLAEGLRVFSDYADGLLLSKEEINRERGVILSEKRASDSVGFRTFVAEFEAMLGKSLLPKRIPIGTPEVITQAERERFVDFWNAWYRPEKMAVVVAGDFADSAAVEKMISDAFSGLEPRAPGSPEPSLGELEKFEGIRAVFHAEPEASATTISLTSLTPYAHERDTAERQIKRLSRSLALAILNRRFSILAKKEDAPFFSAHASVYEQFDFLRDASVEISCRPEQWSEALAAGEQELRRALEYGFTQAEVAEAAANITNQLEQAAKSASTRHSNTIADAIVQHLVSGEVFTTPADDLALLKPALDQVTPADCLATLRTDFRAPGQFVSVTGNARITGDAPAAIAAAYDNAHAVAVAAPQADAENTWSYTDFGPPGEIARREHIEDLGIELVTFNNGARLNLKKTDFEANRISVNARVGNGAITEPPDQRGLAAMAGGTFMSGGLGKYSSDDLRTLLAGKNVGWQFAPEPDALRFSGNTTRDDLLLEFQLLAAHLTDPGYRPEALRVARKGLEQIYLSFQHTPTGPLATEVANLLASGDPRFGMPPEEVMMARNLDEVKAWLTPQLTKGALEIGVVGDFDVDAVIAAAAQTIGALPHRESKPSLDELKKLKFPEQPFSKDYVIESEIPKGSLELYWPSSDGLQAPRNRRLNLLSAVVNDRLRAKVREEIGASYSPRAASNASDTFPGYGYFVASIDVDPSTAGKMSDLVIDLADDLAERGVGEDELERARLPLLTALKESLRSNGYWLSSVAARAQEKPEVLDWARTRIADVEAITTAELSELAEKYLRREHASKAIILPATEHVGAAAAATGTDGK